MSDGFRLYSVPGQAEFVRCDKEKLPEQISLLAATAPKPIEIFADLASLVLWARNFRANAIEDRQYSELAAIARLRNVGNYQQTKYKFSFDGGVGVASRRYDSPQVLTTGACADELRQLPQGQRQIHLCARRQSSVELPAQRCAETRYV